jgi:hypothetical protein
MGMTVVVIDIFDLIPLTAQCQDQGLLAGVQRVIASIIILSAYAFLLSDQSSSVVSLDW